MQTAPCTAHLTRNPVVPILIAAALFVAAAGFDARAELVEVTDDIAADATWVAANTYVLSSNWVHVQGGATLTIEAGAIVKMAPFGTLLVEAGGRVLINGVSGDPVIITGRDDNTVGEIAPESDGDPTTDRWVSLEVSPDSEGDGTLLQAQHAVFRYGGGNEGVYGAPMIRYRAGGVLDLDHCTVARSSTVGVGVWADSDIPLDVSITNCEFIENEWDGVYVEDEEDTAIGTAPTIVNCTFQGNGDGDNDAAVYLQGNVFPDWGGASNTMVPQTGRGVNGVLCSGSITVSGTWSPAGPNLPFRTLVDVLPGGDLTIGPGCIVKQGTANYLEVRPGGALRVQGTETQPVWFTSLRDDEHGGDTNGDGAQTQPGPTDWLSVYLYNDSEGAAAFGRFDHVNFRYGGGTPGVYQKGMLRLAGVSPLFTHCEFYASSYNAVDAHDSNGVVSEPTFQYCSFLYNEGDGINCENTDADIQEAAYPVISNCTFEGNGDGSNDAAVWLEGAVFPDWDSASNTLVPAEGRGTNGVLWRGDVRLSGDLKKPGPDFPYYFDGDVAVPDGITLNIRQGVILKLGKEAPLVSLNAQGGSTLNIIGDPENRVVVTSYWDDAHGGDTDGDGGVRLPQPGDWEFVEYDTDSSAGRASGTIRYADFLYGGKWERSLVEINGCAPIIDSCTFTESEGWAIRAYESDGRHPEATIENCTISGNAGGVENNDANYCLDASNNNWGHATGPRDESDAEDCAGYYNPTALGDSVSDNVLVTPWLLPGGEGFLQVTANLSPLVAVEGAAALSIDVFTRGATVTDFALDVDLSEAPGLELLAERSTHSDPWTAETFTGGVFTYFIDAGTQVQTAVIQVHVTSSLDARTLRIPLRIEEAGYVPAAVANWLRY